MNFDKKKLTQSQIIDSGMALVLICLITLTFFFQSIYLNYLAIGFLLMTMTIPKLLKPFSIFWFSLSQFLGNFMSKLLLSIIFYGFVTPFGRLVLFFKKDPMQRNEYKQSTDTVFNTVNKTFSKNDLENAY